MACCFVRNPDGWLGVWSSDRVSLSVCSLSQGPNRSGWMIRSGGATRVPPTSNAGYAFETDSSYVANKPTAMQPTTSLILTLNEAFRIDRKSVESTVDYIPKMIRFIRLLNIQPSTWKHP